MKDIRCVMQDDLKDCGISCLLSIIRFYNGNVTKEYLRDITYTSNEGVSAYHLIEAAKSLGFESYGVKGEVNNLQKEFFPLIAHVVINKNFQHYVVIYDINKNKKYLTIMDPSQGIIKKISFDEWNKISTNNYIIFQPKKIIPMFVNDNSIWKFIYHYYHKNKYVVFKIIFISFIYLITNAILSYSFQIFNDINNNFINDSYKMILYVLLFIVLIKELSDLFRKQIINILNNSLDRNLLCETFSHIINLPYTYYKNRTLGDLVNRINDCENIKELINNVFISLFSDFTLLMFILFLLFQINVQLSFVLIFISIIISIILLLCQKMINHKIKDSFSEASEVNNYLIESLNYINSIKNFSLETRIDNKFNIKYSKYVDNRKNISSQFNKMDFFKALIISLGNVLIIYLGIIKVKQGLLSVNALISYLMLMNYFISPLENILNLNMIYQNAIVSINRINELFKLDKEDNKYSKKYHLLKLKGDIVVDNISYSYNNIGYVFRNFSLQIKQGEKLLIYGESGKGKSTFARLLIKYFDNYNGRITIGGKELKSINIFTIRHNIIYLSQDEGLWTDSVYNNICLDKKIGYEKFLKICQLTKVDEIVEKSSLGYHLLLEDNGTNLSGGERQRILLARMLLQQGEIYIIDEGMNAIDISRERTILQNIFEEFKAKTIIVISHRFNNADLFDRKLEFGDNNGFG